MGGSEKEITSHRLTTIAASIFLVASVIALLSGKVIVGLLTVAGSSLWLASAVLATQAAQSEKANSN